MNKFDVGLLRAFFEGELSSAGLAIAQFAGSSGALAGARDVSQDASVDCTVTPAHLVKLCDAVLDGHLDPSRLEDFASMLVSSRRFVWNASNLPNDPVDRVIHAWDSPDLNYELSRGTIVKFRTMLTTGKNEFVDADRKSGSQ